VNILSDIVASKQQEIKHLYAAHDLADLARQAREKCTAADLTEPKFYRALAAARAAGRPFFIAEFKRKSPSEGWINRDAPLPAQVTAYAQAGAGAISVLTDGPFFGGDYSDLAAARAALSALGQEAPCLLQKDFVLDPIQIYLAKLRGADLILLIAAILEPDVLEALRQTAASVGMGALVEVHDAEELERIRHLPFPVLGINNRDLKTFRTALNRANALREQAGGRYVVAESGVRDAVDFQMVAQADAFLIGTGLMRGAALPHSFAQHFHADGLRVFKACGIRRADTLEALSTAPFAGEAGLLLGINFSPVSKRRVQDDALPLLRDPALARRCVAVFYQNSPEDIRATLARYPFRAVQLYAGDTSLDFVRSLQQRVYLACALRDAADLAQLQAYAADVDCFILDGAVPGSGQRIGAAIPADFAYPFLLAGGLHADNLAAASAHPRCIGVDVASGIEAEGQVALPAVLRILEGLRAS
jgi:indole-3-glycerol phosphate synthase